MQEQLSRVAVTTRSVVISWIFIIFADARTTNGRHYFFPLRLWLAEFLLSLLMQEQRRDTAAVQVMGCD